MHKALSDRSQPVAVLVLTQLESFKVVFDVSLQLSSPLQKLLEGSCVRLICDLSLGDVLHNAAVNVISCIHMALDCIKPGSP